MERLIKFSVSLLFLMPLGCGVKGHPLPPLNPAPLGRGEPEPKKSLKKAPVKIQESEEGSETEAEEI